MKNKCLFILVVGLLAGCYPDKDIDEPQSTFEGFVVPSHFPEPAYDFEGNPPTEAGFELGRKLFYDKKLSSDNTISCGSCHAQVHGFADHGVSVSTGVNGLQGARNSPSTVNLAWMPSFMWDGGINHIEIMPIAPITTEVEMNLTLNDAVAKLSADSEYPALFEKAFGTKEINSQKILFALTQFQGLIVSSQSKYDKFIEGRLALTDAESRGMMLFEDNCSSCHEGVLQSNFSFQNNGLDSIFTADEGRARITLNPNDLGKFRVPSLRNVGMTGPYMHDGRYFTLQEVLEHYSDGIVQSETLAPELENGLMLSEEEQADIISFLHTLSDFEMISDMRFSEPKN
jgi:cytochrome c peroxidase